MVNRNPITNLRMLSFLDSHIPDPHYLMDYLYFEDLDIWYPPEKLTLHQRLSLWNQGMELSTRIKNGLVKYEY